MRKKLRGKGISNLGQGEECDSAVAFGDWGCWFWGAAGLSAQHRDRQAPTRASLSQPNLASPGTTYEIPISCCTPNKTRTQGTPLLCSLVPRSHEAFPQNRVPEGVRLSRGKTDIVGVIGWGGVSVTQNMSHHGPAWRKISHAFGRGGKERD